MPVLGYCTYKPIYQIANSHVDNRNFTGKSHDNLDNFLICQKDNFRMGNLRGDIFRDEKPFE